MKLGPLHLITDAELRRHAEAAGQRIAAEQIGVKIDRYASNTYLLRVATAAYHGGVALKMIAENSKLLPATERAIRAFGRALIAGEADRQHEKGREVPR